MNDKRYIIRDLSFIDRIIKGYYTQFQVNKFENLDEIDTFIEKYN